MSTLQVAVGLRKKNQLTLPEQIAEHLGVEPGDRLLFEVDPDDPECVHVRRIRRSYAGALEGIYGKTPEEVAEYLRNERASWNR